LQAMPADRAGPRELPSATTADETRLHSTVEDNGPGMPPDVLERLFTPFFTTKPPGQGTGLGLSICHRIVTAMGGTITIDSAVGRGTRARVTLARAVSVALADAPAAPVATSERRRRVLLIDDDMVVLRTAKKVISTRHDVEAVNEPLEALERAATGDFDVIVCD